MKANSLYDENRHHKTDGIYTFESSARTTNHAPTPTNTNPLHRFTAGPVIRIGRSVSALTDEKATQSVAETKAGVLDIIREALKIAREGVPIIAKNGGAVYDKLTGAVLRRPDVGGMLKAAEARPPSCLRSTR